MRGAAGDEAISYYLYDGLGNVTALTDASANVTDTYTYDSYGSLIAQTGLTVNPYTFSTKQFNPTTGLAFFGFRYYNPQVGRWLTPDPLGFIDGPNLYAYVGNNPVNLLDPWGLCGEKPGWPGYININITLGYFGGITFGQIITSSGTHFYIGGGLVTPGISISATYSPSNVIPGWTVAASGAAGIAGQTGYSFGEGGGGFSEIGVGGGYPTIFGGSATIYYVF